MSFGIVAAVGGGLLVGGRIASEGPDMSGENTSAEASAKLGQEQFDWYKAEYAKTQPQRDAAIAQSAKVGDAQLAGMELATQQAKEMADRNKTVFQPLEDKLVADAANFDTAGRRQQAAAEATADVESAFGTAQQGLTRDLARRGVTVGSGRSMSLMQDAALKKATATAGATSSAVKNVEQQGYARTMDAAALGKGIVGNQATMQQIAQTGGAQAVAAAGAGVNAANSGAGLMQQGFSGAMNGLGQAGSLYGQAAKLAQADSEGTMQGIGQLASLGMQLYKSDEDAKKGTGKRISTKKALKGIEATPVDAGWTYAKGEGGAGDDGRPHDGPMAQQVRKHMGEKVAPGGKAIDVASMNAHLMAGMQELTKRVKKIEKQVAA